jgi:predicted outer membrane repeat protein
MICMDGFILSHTAQPLELPKQEEVDDFIPHDFKRHLLLDVDNPMTVGSLNMEGTEGEGVPAYMEHRYFTHKSMEDINIALKTVDQDFKRKFGRGYNGSLQQYRCEDAEVVMISMGTLAAQAKMAVDELRKDGYKVGSAKLRVFRPFPSKELEELGERVKAIAIVDRDISYGSGGAIYTETKAALYGMKQQPLVLGFVAGLGGRDVTPDHQKAIFQETTKTLEQGDVKQEERWFDLKKEVL